jgi:Fur family transcriptional regulator, peroxide stress response regulator
MNRPTESGENGPVDFRASLEAARRGITRLRAAVFHHFRTVNHHPTAEDVYQNVKPRLPSISLAMVYKALETLVESGLATKLLVGNDSPRYGARADRHYRLRCLRSARVEDVPTAFDPDLIATIDPSLGFELEGRGFKVTGYRLELVDYNEDQTLEARAREFS